MPETEARPCDRCDRTFIMTYTRGRADYAQARRCDCYQRCPLCDDTRYFFETDPNGYRFARPCQCVTVDRKITWFNDARIPAKYGRAHLPDFFTHQPGATRPPEVSAAARAALKFAQGFTPGRRGLLLHGPVGTGKTHLTVAILRYLVLRLGVRVRFIEFLHLLADLRATFGDHGRAEDVMRPLVEVPVLAIDELGKGKEGEWERDVLDELISKRYNAHRTTLFTTNCQVEPPPRGGPYPPGTIGRPALRPDERNAADKPLEDRIGTRLYSRIAEMCDFYALLGDDLRRQRSG